MEPTSSSTGAAASAVGPASESVNSWRLGGGVAALSAFVTLALTTLVPWWVIVDPTDVGFSFYLTDTLRLVSISSFTRASLAYESAGMVWIGLLYACLLALVLVALAVSLVAGLLGVFAALGRIRRPYWIKGLRTLLIIGLVLALAATIAGPVAQPAAFAHEKSSVVNVCMLNPGGRSPCTTFWGSVNVSGTLYTWGPSLGWFLAVASTILLFVALFCWWQGRSRTGTTTLAAPESVASPPAWAEGTGPTPPP